MSGDVQPLGFKGGRGGVSQDVRPWIMDIKRVSHDSRRPLDLKWGVTGLSTSGFKGDIFHLGN